MSDIKARQGANLKRLFKHEGITQSEFAEKIGVSAVAVNRWANGHSAIRDYNIRQIQREYPGYSEEFLRGVSDWRNYEEQARDMAVFYAIEAAEMVDDFSKIIKSYCHCSIEGLSKDEIDSYFGACNSVPDSADANPDIQPYIRISNKGKTLVVDYNDWMAFIDEVANYIDMRLYLAIARGYW